MRLPSSHSAPSRATGTRVVLPAPGGACNTAAPCCSSAVTSCGKTESTGSCMEFLSYAFTITITITRIRTFTSGRNRMERDEKASQVALKWGIASAVALGALASGFLISRRGRRFVSDVWHEKRRTPLEDRVIDTIWGEAELGKRPIDVAEIEPGVIAVLGQVRSND